MTGLDYEAFLQLWTHLLKPLGRLLLGMSIGLLAANLIEAAGWDKYLARLISPLARLAHMGQCAQASFAVAFLSPHAANGLLAENYEKGLISSKELLLASIFNGLPTFLTHAPTLFFLLWAAIGQGAFSYMAIILAAALLRLIIAVILGKTLLPKPANSILDKQQPSSDQESLVKKTWKRFRRRLPKLLYFTAPFYVLTWLCQEHGLFQILQDWLSSNLAALYFLKPEAMGIILLQLIAETGASLGAASAIVAAQDLAQKDVVIALLVGNVLATPVRALRHQLPAYAGFFRPAMAMLLIIVNQSLRACTLSIFIALYLII